MNKADIKKAIKSIAEQVKKGYTEEEIEIDGFESCCDANEEEGDLCFVSLEDYKGKILRKDIEKNFDAYEYLERVEKGKVWIYANTDLSKSVQVCINCKAICKYIAYNNTFDIVVEL
ncbi:MAG: hypothetical protein ACLTDM_15320 [Clostridium butyricum]